MLRRHDFHVACHTKTRLSKIIKSKSTKRDYHFFLTCRFMLYLWVKMSVDSMHIMAINPLALDGEDMSCCALKTLKVTYRFSDLEMLRLIALTNNSFYCSDNVTLSRIPSWLFSYISAKVNNNIFQPSQCCCWQQQMPSIWSALETDMYVSGARTEAHSWGWQSLAPPRPTVLSASHNLISSPGTPLGTLLPHTSSPSLGHLSESETHFI